MKIIEPNVDIITPLDGDSILSFIENCGRTCYRSEDNITADSAKTMIKMLIKNGHESVLEHFNITIKATMDIGAYKDLTRHRHASFSIESTRYCNYSKGKFGKELTFIKPGNIDENSPLYFEWVSLMEEIELTYRSMAELGAKPDQLRMILPHSTAAQVCMTANLREWRHILKLRTAKAAHPSVRQIMLKVLEKFKTNIPIVFDDINPE